MGSAASKFPCHDLMPKCSVMPAETSASRVCAAGVSANVPRVKTLIDVDAAPVFALPMLDARGRRVVREGVLVEGPQGWGEFSPDPDADAGTCARWATASVEGGTVGWPDPVRGQVPIAVSVPSVEPATARRIVAAAECAVAEVSVGDGELRDDIALIEAVRDALGPAGAIRCDAHGRWDPETAIRSIGALEKAANGIEFVVQPCARSEDVRAVRLRVDVRVAAAPAGIEAPSADVLVLRSGPLGGVRRALRVAERAGLPCVVASSMETSVGLAAGLALAGALPELPFACALGTRLLLDGDLVGVARQLVPVAGLLPVAPMPPAPDRALLARYAVADSDRVARWRNRLRAADIGHR